MQLAGNRFAYMQRRLEELHPQLSSRHFVEAIVDEVLSSQQLDRFHVLDRFDSQLEQAWLTLTVKNTIRLTRPASS